MVMAYKILPQHSNGTRKTANNFSLGDSLPSQDFSQAPLEHKSRVLSPPTCFIAVFDTNIMEVSGYITGVI
jgi:hypothetical protein